ncbi:unnamed protein product [Hymenolepis diminuta]|uniref:Uncharacterized protein n=1 Tax=Hymenolepis diminuta TaxID=6216 RepID=A0A564YCN1_HYMDI|nr:unnamed protein product [Hymenolepis diminuta]
MFILSNVLFITYDPFFRTFYKSNCGSSSSGFSSTHILPSPDLGNDPNMVTLSAILRSSESRQTFQLLSRVVESRVKLAWIPSVIRRFPLVAQAGIDTEMVKPDKVIYYHYIL